MRVLVSERCPWWCERRRLPQPVEFERHRTVDARWCVDLCVVRTDGVDQVATDCLLQAGHQQDRRRDLAMAVGVVSSKKVILAYHRSPRGPGPPRLPSTGLTRIAVGNEPSEQTCAATQRAVRRDSRHRAAITSSGAWISSISTPSPLRGVSSLPFGWMKQTS